MAVQCGSLCSRMPISNCSGENKANEVYKTAKSPLTRRVYSELWCKFYPSSNL
jgi:hypothetical protein